MAVVYNKIKSLGRKKNSDTSIYSMVSCSDLTPGSLEVWIDLPDEIKFDPALSNFKTMYERSQARNEHDQDTGIQIPNNAISKRNAELAPIGEDKEKEPEETCLNTEEAENKEDKQNEEKSGPLHIIKLIVLTIAWTLLTASLMMNSEKDNVVLHTAVNSKEIKAYDLARGNQEVRIQVTLTGPFLMDSSGNSSSRANTLKVWLHRSTYIGSFTEGAGQDSVFWSIPLQPDDILDFSPSVSVTQTLILPENILTSVPNSHHRVTEAIAQTDYNNTDNEYMEYTTEDNAVAAENGNIMSEDIVLLQMQTKSRKIVPLNISYLMNPLAANIAIMYAAFLLLGLYILIIFEVINRTLAALLVSSLGIGVLAVGGARPALPELMSWLDVETLLLLFGMMLLVAILSETGLFDYLAVLAFELTGGRTWPLINCLCFFTALFSTFLDNVTTVLLMTPITIRLCEVKHLNPVPVLMCMVIFSNVGGAATPVGDPPNVIIASHPTIINAGINFANFALHMGVGIIFVSIQTYIQLRYMYRDMNKLRHTVPQDIIELRQAISVWRRAAASLSSYSRDEELVRKALERKVKKLSDQLRRREAGVPRADPSFTTTLAEMKKKYCIRNTVLLWKASVCIGFVVCVFFLHAIPELQRLSLGWTALLGALLLLLLADSDDIDSVLSRVEWSTLLFFASLFVFMEVLAKLGLIAWVGTMTENVILSVGKDHQLAVAILLILWVSGVVSAFVDNIPLTTMMIRVIATLSDPTGLGLPLSPLAWSLSFGACLGGNGTLIGASANVVCAGVADNHGYKITFVEFLKTGFPIMIGNLIIATIYLLICHVALTWH